MNTVDIVELNGHVPSKCPHSALDDLWSKAELVLRHYTKFNQDEARVRFLQHRILEQGALIVPSLFKIGGDHCTSSYYFKFQIYYHFKDQQEEYFWITSLLGQGYVLAALYFPARRVAIALYPHILTQSRLHEFEQMRAVTERSASLGSSQPCVVIGFHHMIHTLWNELPALDRAINAGLSQRMRISVTHQPLGPLDEIFPELRGKVEMLQLSQVGEFNSVSAMPIAIGAYSIPASTQARVLRVARRHMPRSVATVPESFAAFHPEIFWISVKPAERTCANQAEVLAAIINALHAEHPSMGFLLNGVSYPWDYTANPNYGSWYRELMVNYSAQTEKIIVDIRKLLSPGLEGSVIAVTDVDVMEEIVWGASATFYFCHGGSMQNKIGWFHRTPGIVHSNRSFLRSMRTMRAPLEEQCDVYLVPTELIVDDAPSRYTPVQLARKDQNYHFASQPAVVEFILETYRQHQIRRPSR